VVKRAKAGAPVECGRQVVLDEGEGGILTRFPVLADQQSDCHQALPAVPQHRALFGRPRWWVTGDRSLHTKGVPDRAQGRGVTHGVIARTGTRSAAQRTRQQQRRWRRRSRWRAGIAGRIHSWRRDDGLAPCRSHGQTGRERDVGGGVLASHLRQIAQAHATHATRRPSARDQAASHRRSQPW
jgi:transposase, IS5 family